jgi:glycosyltransferase 2 family protein
MDRRRIITSIFFFFIGVALFWIVYRDFNTKQFLDSLDAIRFKWILAAIGFGLLSHLIRAIRWKMLIEIMGYKPTTGNLFLSVIILYFTNLALPRGGEISRCAVITRYEKIPFIKLAGTVFIERLTDMVAFFLILLILIVWQFSFFKTLINYPEFELNLSLSGLNVSVVIIGVILAGALAFSIIKLKIFNKLKMKLRKFKGEFLEGIRVIKHLKNRMQYIVYTLLIFILWVLMLFVVFFAYPPTDHLSFVVAVLTFTCGTLAYLLPIQAGIGAWHFIVINCLFLYGIDKESGMIFALVAHTFTNLIFVIFGPIALGLLPLINRTNSDTLIIIPERELS